MDSSASVAQLCPTLCDPMDYSTPGFPVHHQLPEFAQTHVHRVGNASHLIFCHPLLLLPSILPGSGSFPVSPKSYPGWQFTAWGEYVVLWGFPTASVGKNRWNSLPPCFERGPDLFLFLFTSGGQDIGVSASASVLKCARWLLLMPVSPGKEGFLEVYG